jgi:hypothetical protein
MAINKCKTCAIGLLCYPGLASKEVSLTAEDFHRMAHGKKD